MNKKTTNKVITSSILFIYIILITFAIIASNPPEWLKNISQEDKQSDAVLKKNFGDIFLEKKKYNQAIMEYEQSLEIKADQPEVLTNMAVAYFELNKSDNALNILKYAIELAPANPSVIYFNIGNIYDKRNQVDIAIPYFKKALETAPFKWQTYTRLGDIYVYKKDYDSAIFVFKKAIENKSDIKIAYKGMLKRDRNIYRYQKDVKEAIDNELKQNIDLKRFDAVIFNNSLKNNVELAKIYNQLGYAYFMQNDFEIAIKKFKKALNIYPGFYQAYNNLNAVRIAKENIKQ